MINVTKSYLPDFDEYVKYIKGVWNSGWLTNKGVLEQELESKIKNYLDVNHVITLNNGTIALQIAIKALKLKGEIITTPFSYVATTSSIVWENCTPIFADIDKNTLCIDPDEIEKSINENTAGIMATHVYGIPCDVERLDEISRKYNIPVIYDAAHAFGVEFKGKSLMRYGTMSTLSFHATKLFHTIEGGAIVTGDEPLYHTMEYMRRFGHNGPYEFHGLGINGKMSEFHAAMGLCILPHMEEIISKRKTISNQYDDTVLKLNIVRPSIPDGTKYNYAYYPILLKDEREVEFVHEALAKNDICGRRYFYPSLNKLAYVEYKSMPISESVASRVYCLPMYPDLTSQEIEQITTTLKKALH